ncbi:TolC family protein [Tepidimonas taiwanensis]|nr:TolC family protein [Tepidimonas taiwanensis]MCX7692092.1 TolC family protein [Tepidimonas taiwanensis]UBQ05878.1 TolC family protein [Tepidimonas taiwanensis]
MSLSGKPLQGIARRGGWALLAAGLVGCASVPPAGSSVALPKAPAGWANPVDGVVAPTVTATEPLNHWWATWGDEMLSRLVESALQSNPDVARALAAVAQARAQREVARAGLGPTVQAGADVQRAQRGDASPGNTFRLGLDAAWEVDVWGRRAAALQASEADAAASEAEWAWARVTLAAEVASTYFEWWGARERLRLARESVAAQEESVQLTDWRVQAGLASVLDAQTARAALEQTRASLPALEATARQAQHALAVLTGQAPGTPLPGPAPDLPPALRVPPVPVPAQVLRQRPDVAAAEARLRAAYARVQQADAARWPTLGLEGALSLSAPRVTELFDVAALTRSLAVSLAASVFDGGAARAEVQARQAAAEQARAALASALLGALRDVENALVALAADRERLQRLDAAVAAAAEAESLARQRYAAGLIDYRALLDAQRTLLALQTDRAAAQTAWASDHVRLIKAVGGGWENAARVTEAAATTTATP